VCDCIRFKASLGGPFPLAPPNFSVNSFQNASSNTLSTGYFRPFPTLPNLFEAVGFFILLLIIFFFEVMLKEKG
jgi:hypothetical protein